MCVCVCVCVCVRVRACACVYHKVKYFSIFFSQNNSSLLMCLLFGERGYSGQFMLTFKRSDTECAALSIVMLRIFYLRFYMLFTFHIIDMKFIFVRSNSLA